VHARINLDLYLHLEQQKQTNNRAILELLSLTPEQTLLLKRMQKQSFHNIAFFQNDSGTAPKLVSSDPTPVRHLLNLTLVMLPVCISVLRCNRHRDRIFYA
jgi:hypothetical protein